MHPHTVQPNRDDSARAEALHRQRQEAVIGCSEPNSPACEHGGAGEQQTGDSEKQFVFSYFHRS